MFAAWLALTTSSSLDTLSHPSPCKPSKVKNIPEATEGMVTQALKAVRERGKCKEVGTDRNSREIEDRTEKTDTPTDAVPATDSDGFAS